MKPLYTEYATFVNEKDSFYINNNDFFMNFYIKNMEIGKGLWYTCSGYYVNQNNYVHGFVRKRRERLLVFEEKRIDGEVKYEGVIVTVRLDRAQLHNGKLVKREVVEHPGGVTVLPVDENGVCTLVRQFRYPFGRMMLEAPAGKLERGEDVRLCAERELSEETGYSADEYISLGCCCTSPGITDEVLHLYLALGLHKGDSHPDEDEFLNVERIPLRELSRMAMANEIEDAKTVIAVLKAEKYLSERGMAF